MSMLNWWFKKESPFQGLIGFGGGATGLNAVGAGGNWTPSGVTATGGTKVTGVKMSDNTPYTYHFFTDTPESPSSQTFSVSAVTGPGDVEYIVVAGGVNVDAGIGTFDAGLAVGTGAPIFSPASNVITAGTASTEVVRINANAGVQ